MGEHRHFYAPLTPSWCQNGRKLPLQAIHKPFARLAAFKSGPGCSLKHTFSAFWLRSSVVSVLISLISGTSTNVGMMIKCLSEAFD